MLWLEAHWNLTMKKILDFKALLTVVLIKKYGIWELL